MSSWTQNGPLSFHIKGSNKPWWWVCSALSKHRGEVVRWGEVHINQLRTRIPCGMFLSCSEVSCQWVRQWLHTSSVPRSYLNQCFLIINFTLGDKLQTSVKFNSKYKKLSVNKMRVEICKMMCPCKVYVDHISVELKTTVMMPAFFITGGITWCHYDTVVATMMEKLALQIKSNQIALQSLQELSVFSVGYWETVITPLPTHCSCREFALSHWFYLALGYLYDTGLLY